jgi:hypothetical protein
MSTASDSQGDRAAEVEAITARLREIAARLRDPELPEAEGGELAREAADLVSRAGNEIDRALRGPAEEPR